MLLLHIHPYNYYSCFFFLVYWGSNLEPCLYYLLSLPTELSSREQNINFLKSKYQQGITNAKKINLRDQI